MKLKSKCHNLHEMKTRHKRQYVNNTPSTLYPFPYCAPLTPLPPYQSHGSASLRLISRPRPASASALQTNHIIMIERSQRRRRRQLFCSFALHLRLITLLPPLLQLPLYLPRAPAAAFAICGAVLGLSLWRVHIKINLSGSQLP